MSIELRPVVYFPTMTDEELISYAESYSETNLEKELSTRLKLSMERNENADDPERDQRQASRQKRY